MLEKRLRARIASVSPPSRRPTLRSASASWSTGTTSATTGRRSKGIDLLAMPKVMTEAVGLAAAPVVSGRRSVDGELLRLRIEVPEPNGSARHRIADPEDVHALRNFALVDEIVVPVRGPGAAEVGRRERGGSDQATVCAFARLVRSVTHVPAW